jgi:hypothetical protein
MAKEPENMTLLMLREIRAKQDEHTARFDTLLARVDAIEKPISRLSKFTTYSLGQSDETQFLQSQQEMRIDQLFEKLEELLSKPHPV